MIHQQTVRCYAQAFYDRISAGAIEESIGRLESVWKVCADYPELVDLLNHPFVESQKKTELITGLFDKIIEGEIRSLLLLLIKHRVFEMVPYIIQELRSIYLERSSSEEVSVVSPFELTDQEKETLTRTVQEGIHKKISATYRVDKGLIAGLYIRMKSLVIDTTLKGQLMNMRQSIMKNLERSIT